MDQVIQIVGALLVLTAFAGAQMGRLRTDSLVYLTLNLVGSIILLLLAVFGGLWGFALLELAWGVVSLVGLVTFFRGAATADRSQA